MREILFRGKPTRSVLNSEDFQDCKFDIVDGFVYGNLIADEHKPIIVGKVGDSDWDYCSMEWWCPVVKETVGQFTGLHDATKWEDLTDAERDEWIKSGHTKEDWKGRKIFEGDIFTSDYFDDTYNFEVVFSDGAFCGKHKSIGIYMLGFTNYDDNGEDLGYWGEEDYTSHIQIIGNIHNNPELLEAK